MICDKRNGSPFDDRFDDFDLKMGRASEMNLMIFEN